MPHVVFYVSSKDVAEKLVKLIPDLHKWMITSDMFNVGAPVLSINTIKTEYNGNHPKFDVFTSVRCKAKPDRTEAKMKDICDALNKKLKEKLGIKTARVRYEVFDAQSQAHDLAAESKL